MPRRRYLAVSLRLSLGKELIFFFPKLPLLSGQHSPNGIISFQNSQVAVMCKCEYPGSQGTHIPLHSWELTRWGEVTSAYCHIHSSQLCQEGFFSQFTGEKPEAQGCTWQVLNLKRGLCCLPHLCLSWDAPTPAFWRPVPGPGLRSPADFGWCPLDVC